MGLGLVRKLLFFFKIPSFPTLFHYEISFQRKKEVWRKVIKCVIAYEIGIILILIPKFTAIAGNPPYLVPLGTLFFNASGTAGNQIAQMVLNFLMMLPTAIWCGIISYLCTIYNTARLTTSPNLYSNGPGVIAGISFAMCVFVVAYYRLKYPRLYIPALQGFTLPFFVLTKGIYGTQYDIMNVVGTFYPVLIGGAIALLVNLVLWPETAAKSAELVNFLFFSISTYIRDIGFFYTTIST